MTYKVGDKIKVIERDENKYVHSILMGMYRNSKTFSKSYEVLSADIVRGETVVQIKLELGTWWFSEQDIRKYINKVLIGGKLL